jgi:hypothetical protein
MNRCGFPHRGQINGMLGIAPSSARPVCANIGVSASGEAITSLASPGVIVWVPVST